jgi:hypothetical protein
VAKVFAELDSRQRDIKRAKERDKQAVSYAIWKLEADPEDQRPSEARREPKHMDQVSWGENTQISCKIY